MLHFRNNLKSVRICKIVRAETSLNNAPFSNCCQCSQCIAQCSVMNEYAEDLHGNDILDRNKNNFNKNLDKDDDLENLRLFFCAGDIDRHAILENITLPFHFEFSAEFRYFLHSRLRSSF